MSFGLSGRRRRRRVEARGGGRGSVKEVMAVVVRQLLCYWDCLATVPPDNG